jgi:hypothetical protein
MAANTAADLTLVRFAEMQPVVSWHVRIQERFYAAPKPCSSRPSGRTAPTRGQAPRFNRRRVPQDTRCFAMALLHMPSQFARGVYRTTETILTRAQPYSSVLDEMCETGSPYRANPMARILLRGEMRVCAGNADNKSDSVPDIPLTSRAPRFDGHSWLSATRWRGEAMAGFIFSQKSMHGNALKGDVVAQMVAAPRRRIFSRVAAFFARMHDPTGKEPSVLPGT